jgi:murein DD-endopeptidase MepM/ murein hydrolase activator NlpD
MPAPAIPAEVRIKAAGSPAASAATAALAAPCDTTVSVLYCVYTVQSGDTLGAIAGKFGLQNGEVTAADLIAHSNKPDVSDANELSIGQKLRIPTRQAVLHTAFGGDTYSSIADTYDVPLAEIVAVNINRISNLDSLRVGDEVLVPSPKQFAVALPVAAAAPASSGGSTSGNSSSSGSSSGATSSGPQVVRGGQSSRSGFIWPVGGPISSYFGPSHPLGIDVDLFSNPNAAVGAANSGTVTFAGGNACCSYGYYVVVNHGNGFETLYAHFSKIAVSTGQQVSKGQLLGYGGRTGYATGNHLHFEVHLNGKVVNPIEFLP